MANQRISIKDCVFHIGNNIIGGSEEVSITVTRDNTEAYEGGTYFPAEIVDGQIHISGSITRAFVDVDLLNTICPHSNLWPAFTITGEIISGKTPGRTVTIIGAKFDSFDINGLGLDGYAKNTLPFKAIDWKLV